MEVIESLSKIEVIEGMKYKYFYRLIKSSFSTTLHDKKVNVDCFGIEVERHDIINNCIAKIERESIERISPYRYKVHNLLKFINDNAVSPIHLIDVLGEYVDEYILDFNDSIENLDEQLSQTIMC
jgi:hypothetical protein